jgi:hypothetical protein
MALPPAQPDDLSEARELILALCHERLPKDGQARLEALMIQRPDVRLLYLEMIRVHAILQLRAGSFSMLRLENADIISEADMSDAMILPALTPAEPEPEAEPLPVFAAPEPLPAPEPLRRLRIPGWRTMAWMSVAAAIVLTASIFFMQQEAARPAVAATILKSYDAHFDGTDLDPSPGVAIPTGKAFSLASGYVELKFHGGADVVFQAPAVFTIDSGVAMGLTSGRISATADGPAHGFAVQTPTARVTDLGTAFGVTVEPAGRTEVDVFQGRVEVAQIRAAGDTSPAQSPAILSVGQAAVADNGAVKPSADGAAPQNFVRSLAAPASIDLVDLICGGDGTTGLRSGGINPRTGASGLLKPDFDIPVANSDYHAVPKLQVVDGCFVPNGNIKIDSAGHRFDFGKTTATSFFQIRAGGHIPWAKTGLRFTANLGGVDYAQPGHGFFLLHPNAGITFDLAALRKLHPGLKISDLRSIVGNPCPSPEYNSVSRVRVLVNGTVRFDRQISRKDGPLDMNVPLNDADQFLTMVATDDGVSPRYDWIIIADPRFE